MRCEGTTHRFLSNVMGAWCICGKYQMGELYVDMDTHQPMRIMPAECDVVDHAE